MMHKMKRGSDRELEPAEDIAVMDVWPADEILAGPETQYLQRGARPRDFGETPEGATVMGDVGCGNVQQVFLDGAWHDGHCPGSAPGYRCETRRNWLMFGRMEFRFIRTGAAGGTPAPTGRAARKAAKRAGRPMARKVVRPAIPGIAEAVTAPEEEGEGESQDSPPEGEGLVGYWTELTRTGTPLNAPDWVDIGYGPNPVIAGYAAASLATHGTAPQPQQYGQAPQQYAPPPTRSLSSETLDRLSNLNTALQGMPDSATVAPMIQVGLSAGRYAGERGFYHAKDYGESIGKAAGVLALANTMTGNEPLVQRMINEARDRLNDARGKLREITGG